MAKKPQHPNQQNLFDDIAAAEPLRMVFETAPPHSELLPPKSRPHSTLQVAVHWAG